MNSEMRAKDIDAYALLTDDATEVLKQAMHKLSLSARSYHKVVKVARTIADLDESETTDKAHVLEALQYRPKMLQL